MVLTQLAEGQNIGFIETNGKTNHNIDEVRMLNCQSKIDSILLSRIVAYIASHGDIHI